MSDRVVRGPEFLGRSSRLVGIGTEFQWPLPPWFSIFVAGTIQQCNANLAVSNAVSKALPRLVLGCEAQASGNTGG